MNPYESPKTSTLNTLSSPDRLSAGRALRTGLCFLLVPAMYNFFCFNLLVVCQSVDQPLLTIYLFLNTAGALLLAAAVWFLGLSILEAVVRGIHAALARRCSVTQWKLVLYSTLLRTPHLAFVGALLWTGWIVAYYHLNANFFLLSVHTAIAGNLLAARLYMQLAYGWYRLENERRPSVTS